MEIFLKKVWDLKCAGKLVVVGRALIFMTVSIERDRKVLEGRKLVIDERSEIVI